MKTNTFLLVLALWTTACTTAPKQQLVGKEDTMALHSSDSLMAYAAAPVTTGCYRYLSDGGDTLMLRITSVNNKEVVGNLDCRYRKKDNHSGTFLGTLQGDTLLANYSFLSKGKRSVKQVAFLRRGTGWAEGYGPTEGRDAVRMFADYSKIRFDKVVYQPSGCR